MAWKTMFLLFIFEDMIRKSVADVIRASCESENTKNIKFLDFTWYCRITLMRYLVFSCQCYSLCFFLLEWRPLLTNPLDNCCESMKHSRAVGHLKSGIVSSVCLSVGRWPYLYNSYPVYMCIFTLCHIAVWKMYHNTESRSSVYECYLSLPLSHPISPSG